MSIWQVINHKLIKWSDNTECQPVGLCNLCSYLSAFRNKYLFILHYSICYLTKLCALYRFCKSCVCFCSSSYIIAHKCDAACLFSFIGVAEMSQSAAEDSPGIDWRTGDVPFISQRSIDSYGGSSRNVSSVELSSRNQSVAYSLRKRASMKYMAYRDRLRYSKRDCNRLILKNGECNVWSNHVKSKNQRFIADFFTTLLDLRWRWYLLMFMLTFALSWLTFAVVWWLISYTHDDFDNRHNDTWTPCIMNIEDFTTALLFSIETQSTIGYGTRSTTNECGVAVVTMMLQTCFGVMVQALMTGLFFAKLSRSKKRAQTLLFSKNAVICTRNGQLMLLCRVGDMRRSHIIQASVRGFLIKQQITKEGETLPFAEYDISFTTSGISNNIFLAWPVILQHCIDENSPLYDVSAANLNQQPFELIVILEGVTESTGMTTQARTSYLPHEIRWGHRFERLVTSQKESGHYTIDYSRFNHSFPIECIRLSSKEQASGGTDTSVAFTCDNNNDSITQEEEILNANDLAMLKCESYKIRPHIGNGDCVVTCDA